MAFNLGSVGGGPLRAGVGSLARCRFHFLSEFGQQALEVRRFLDVVELHGPVSLGRGDVGRDGGRCGQRGRFGACVSSRELRNLGIAVAAVSAAIASGAVVWLAWLSIDRGGDLALGQAPVRSSGSEAVWRQARMLGRLVFLAVASGILLLAGQSRAPVTAFGLAGWPASVR